MKSQQTIVLLGIVLVVMIAGLAFMLQKSRQTSAQALPQIDPLSIQLSPKTGGLWETKADTQAKIGVEVTPVNLSATSSEWMFDIAMNTHSDSLDADIIKIAALTDDSGNTYQPFKWEGDPAGGHHRAGLLSFKTIAPMPKTIILEISSIGEVERVFTWDLNKI